jgi:phosphatidyl-myo-inositol alpha-mannosyltransferase
VPVRIGLVSPYSLTLPGGVQGQVLGLARAVRAKGHEVRVLGPCDGPPPDAGVTPLGVSLPTATNGSVAPIAPDISAQLRTIRALRDEDFDVIHLHEPFVPGPTQTAMLFKAAPLVGTFHAAGSALAYKWFSPVVRRVAGRLDVRCAVSQDALNAARDALGGTYELVFNAVDPAEFTAGDPWPTEAPTVLFLGRHEPRKGLGVLLEAFAGLPAETRLWVAGEGPETEALQRAHPDERITWLGRISEAEKVARLQGADVFCAPSLHGESFGIVLLEAMAAGTPVVASALDGYSRVARDGLDGLLVPPGDAEALCRALMAVLGNPATAAELVASGRQRAAGYSMERLAGLYEEIYASVARR